MPAGNLPTPASPDARYVFAVIPSVEPLQLVFEAGQLPHELWMPGKGTYEDALLRIGQRTVGRALSPDWAHHMPQGMFYLTEPVEPEIEANFGPDVSWAGFRIARARHDTVRTYWQKFITDMINDTHPGVFLSHN
jgi:hypothetical protein